jgi:hypothetical protein
MEFVMVGSSFVPEVKEREAGQPCFVVLNTEDSGLRKKQITFYMPDGTGIEQAQEFARALSTFQVRVDVG